MQNYYSNWKEVDFSCQKCGWSGHGQDLEQGDLGSELVEFCCPACGESVTTILLPTLEDAHANWDKLDALERQQVTLIEQHASSFEQQKLEAADQLPDIPDHNFTLTWDFDPATYRTLIKHGDQVLFSEPAGFECYERFEEIAVVLRQKYGRRIRDLCPTSRSETYLYGDRLAAPRIVDGVRQKLFGASDGADGGAAKSASTELRVMDGLQQIGWNVASSGLCHVKFDGFEVNAVEGVLPGRPVHGVQFSGAFFSARTIAEIDFALPAHVESLDQLKAFLAYYLDGASDERAKSQNEPAWLIEGRALSALLPWEREQAEYHARDHCTVERDWMRFGLNKLKDSLAGIADSEAIDFAFDGSLLRIETTAGLVVVPGNGKAWERSHCVAAGALRDLPRRLNHRSVCVGAWKGQLQIANRTYPLLKQN